LSSTRDQSDLGQVLAIFALSLTAILLAGALAFDGGVMFVERRDQQNAADAAAIAGARYLTGSIASARSAAEAAARAIADANGFRNGDGDIFVDVNIPPRNGTHRGLNGYIEVEITNNRPSVFAGVMGVFDWDVSARAVARNSDASGGDFTVLALDPEGCNAFKVTGSGNVKSRGDIQVNSTCPNGAMTSGGGGDITILSLDTMGGACSVVGPGPNSIAVNGGGSISCVRNMGASAIDDPLVDLPPPAMPGLPDEPELLQGEPSKGIPAGCPGGSNAATLDSPRECAFQNNTYVGTTWLLHPGLYPGGLDLSTGTFHLAPGIYYIGGGGLSAGGKDATVLTSDGIGGLDFDGSANRGVMFYNTDLDNDMDSCGDDWKPISLNGGYADFEMLPFRLDKSDPDSIYNNIVIYNDRACPTDPALKSVTLNGGGSNFELRGVVYSPRGEVYVNGNSATVEFTLDQVIAYKYTLNGNGGSILARNDGEYRYEMRAVGLIE
jgi:hypothetical protein